MVSYMCYERRHHDVNTCGSHSISSYLGLLTGAITYNPSTHHHQPCPGAPRVSYGLKSTCHHIALVAPSNRATIHLSIG